MVVWGLLDWMRIAIIGTLMAREQCSKQGCLLLSWTISKTTFAGDLVETIAYISDVQSHSWRPIFSNASLNCNIPVESEINICTKKFLFLVTSMWALKAQVAFSVLTFLSCWCRHKTYVWKANVDWTIWHTSVQETSMIYVIHDTPLLRHETYMIRDFSRRLGLMLLHPC